MTLTDRLMRTGQLFQAPITASRLTLAQSAMPVMASTPIAFGAGITLGAAAFGAGHLFG